MSNDSGFSSLWTDCPEGLTAMGNWQGIWQPGCVFVDVFEFFCVSFYVLRFLLSKQHLFHFLSFSHFVFFHFDFVSFFCFLCFLFLRIMCSEVRARAVQPERDGRATQSSCKAGQRRATFYERIGTATVQTVQTMQTMQTLNMLAVLQRYSALPM